MVRKTAGPIAKTSAKIRHTKKHIVLSAALKAALTAHSKWPRLLVDDWYPIVCEHWGLSEKLKYDDPRYRKIHDFCKNARKR